MSTSVKPGQKIRIAVPITKGDDTPIGARTETRISTVEIVRENGIIEETEGTVRSDRMGIDWEISHPVAEDAEANLVVLATRTGPVLASLLRVTGKTIEVFSERLSPSGRQEFPVRACGKSWDWLKGRTLGEAYKTLTEVIDPIQLVTTAEPGQPVQPAEVTAAPKTGKKRGPKPRALSVTASTEVLPAVASDPGEATMPAGIVPTFAERAELWNLHKSLVLEAEVGNVEHVEELIETLKRWCEGVRRTRKAGDRV
jgi:hypothetical protein